jgi:hypothetical protein
MLYAHRDVIIPEGGSSEFGVDGIGTPASIGLERSSFSACINLVVGGRGDWVSWATGLCISIIDWKT